ncbi:protein transporter sec61 subunit gamma [Ophiostoma piceae UAMH 11346]|uniref:Protein transporter sec61 subunit gamma n=1 Tax=Ophiostoma piceae (strain UAMH 11346) TaxID=1262450 RepID=S3C3P9_OPHP1|nr:protein transporter sec61 subunit gamma [Ophiostoma piceae UAMH 11346]
MSDQVQEVLDIPREFIKDGMQFLNRCQKLAYFRSPRKSQWLAEWCRAGNGQCGAHATGASVEAGGRRSAATAQRPLVVNPKKLVHFANSTAADTKEFAKISQAVGVGFLVMGAVGYLVKLVHIPLNNLLVGGA